VSIEGVYPSACISWFQAAQACALSGKRLLTNQEWQVAAAGTADPGANDGTKNAKCNTGVPPQNIGALRQTGQAGGCEPVDPDPCIKWGAKDACVSKSGAEDMVGNVDEWVADWAEIRSENTSWGSDFGNDISAVGNPGSVCCVNETVEKCEPGDAPGRARCQPARGESCCQNLAAVSVPSLFAPVNPHLPAPLARGGNWQMGENAGVFAVGADQVPYNQSLLVGFRCGR
jgi:formylglycine-generating enzyme required for sulfatase activity